MRLWQRNSKGQTWEYMYFLDSLTEISVPVEDFNMLLGYEPHYTPQGFYSIKPEKVDYLCQKFGSIEEFLAYLVEGKWIEKTEKFTPEIKREIVKERVSRQIGRTDLLEANLENFLADRVGQLEEGLKLIGRQVDTGIVGRLDLLCEDAEGNLVVVELKKGKAGSSVIEQISRYMGWAKEHKATPGQEVRGIIVVGQKDTYLEYAAKANPLIQVKVFSISFV